MIEITVMNGRRIFKEGIMSEADAQAWLRETFPYHRLLRVGKKFEELVFIGMGSTPVNIIFTWR